MAAKKPRKPQIVEQPRSLPLDGYSRDADLRPFIPFCSETQRRRELEGRFPKRVQLGSARCVGWPNREIHKWLADPDGYRAEGHAQEAK